MATKWRWIILGILIGIILAIGAPLIAQQAVSVINTPTVTATSAGDVASGSTDSGNPVKTGGRADTTKPTAVTDGQRVNEWYAPTGATVTAVPVCDGTAVNISATTSETDGTTTDAQLYLMSVTGATAHCIWGATATTTTGFQVPEGSIFYTTAEGTNLSCITVAGTATVRLVPCDFDGA